MPKKKRPLSEDEEHLTPIQLRRYALGLSQSEVAAAAGITIKTYQMAETYQSEPGVIKALRIAIVLRSTVDTLWRPALNAK